MEVQLLHENHRESRCGPARPSGGAAWGRGAGPGRVGFGARRGLRAALPCAGSAYTVLFSPQQLLDDYPKCFVVGADNVGSKQMQQIRMSLRGKAVVLMGKNTMMRKAIRGHLENNPALEKWVTGL